MRNRSPRSNPKSSGPRPELAFRLSLAAPGLGLIYAGAPLRGALFFVLALLGLSGILEWVFDPRRYLNQGVPGALLMGASWSASAWHARKFSEKLTEWPRLYRFFARPTVWQRLGAVRAEILMALLFLLFLLSCAMGAGAPTWLPEPPRYWFLYEVFVAIYLAVFHGIVEVRGKSEGLEEARITGFLVLTLLATGSLLWVTSVPVDVLLFAYLIALPSCWFSLRHRGREKTQLQVARVFFTLPLVFLAFWAYAFVVVFWELVSGVPQYQMRLAKDETVAFAVVGLFYYLLRAALETLIHLPVPEPPPQIRE